MNDQFPRNLYRQNARAFANDSLAIDAAREGVLRGDDLALTIDQRVFFYLPFEHSESLLDQHTSVGLYSKLRDDTPPAHRELSETTLSYAEAHRSAILRFGRFPHRNTVLGRASRPDEIEYLEQGGGFG